MTYRPKFDLDDSAPATADSGIFGVNCPPDEANIVLIPVPWEATVSYGTGTAQGPDAMLAASRQVDLFDISFGDVYRAGIVMQPLDETLVGWNSLGRERAVHSFESDSEEEVAESRGKVNELSDLVNSKVYEGAKALLAEKRLVGVIGGDHSCPLGLIKALGEVHPHGFGILHFDAHFDLRHAYEGFTYSHASIMYNAIREVPQVLKLTQIGIRDFCSEEMRFAEDLKHRSSVFYGRDLFRRKARGERFADITKEIIDGLPNHVYISFDIDGLDASYCPSTGTPVAGGIGFDEAVYILEEVVTSGRTIVGFDLCEVAPGKDGDEWDANVGARILYKLCGAMAQSQRLLEHART